MSADRYDLILTYDSTDYSYMLRQQNDTKDWLVSDAPLLPQTLITQSASPSNIQPEREIQISQVDWRKGFQDFMLDDEHRYYESENCDARSKGEVTLSPKKLSAISFGSEPATVTLTDGGLELWDDASTPTEWTESGIGVTRGSTVKHGGSYSAAQTISTNSGTISQEFSWDNKYRGCEFTLTAWARSGSCGGTWARVYINDGDGASTMSGKINTANETWEQGSVTRRLSQSATQLRFGISYATTAPYDIYMDDAAISYDAPSYGAIVDEVEFGDDIIVAMGNCLFNITTGSAVQILTLPKTITDLCVFGNRLYIAQGWADEYFYTSDLSTFTECTLSNSTAKYMSNVGDGQFWISDTNSTMRDSDNPINGETAFSTAYQVGSDDWDITGLVDHTDIVFCRKEDDLYYLSVADVLSLLGLKSEASTTYTYGLHLWGNSLYIGSGVNSLYEYDITAGVATGISPVRYASGDSNYDEKVTAMCHDETYLYLAIDNGSDIKILAGRWENVDGDTDWWWHPLYDKTSNDITSMLISSATGSKRLYAGTDTYTDGIYPFFVSVGYSAPYLESGYECEASGDFITPWYSSNFPTEDKFWKSVDITSKCITGKTSIVPYYQIKGGSWVAMTTCTTSTDEYPAETTDSRTIELSSERIRFKFAMAAANTDFTPILYGIGGGIAAFAVLQPTKKRQIAATIQLAPQIRLRDDATEDRVVATDLSNLRTLYQANAKMTLTGPDETEYDVVFARDGYQEQLGYDDTNRLEYWYCRVLLLEI